MRVASRVRTIACSLLVALVVACEKHGDEETQAELPIAAQRVVHFVDALEPVREFETPLSSLVAPTGFEEELVGGIDVGGGFRSYALSCPVGGELRVHREGDTGRIPLSEASSRAEASSNHSVFLPAYQEIRAEAFHAEGVYRERRARSPSYWFLAADESARIAIESDGSEVLARFVIQIARARSARIEVTVDGESVHAEEVEAGTAREIEVRRSLPPGVHEWSITARDPRELASSELRVLRVLGLELQRGGGDAVLVSAPEPIFAEYRPALPPSLVIHEHDGGTGELRAWSLGQPVEIRANVALHGIRVGSAQRPRLSAGETWRFTPPGGPMAMTYEAEAGSIELRQPSARLLPFLVESSTWPREDLVGDGPRAEELGRSLIRRVSCRFDRRMSFVLPPPSHATLDVTDGEAGVLRMALGIADDPRQEGESPRGERARLIVRWQDSGEVLLDQTVAHGDEWLDLEVQLPSTRPGALVLETETVDGAPGTVPLCIADPRTFAPDVEVERPNLLVYLIDTLRADALSSLGNERETTPALDALAADGYLFSECFSVASWTRPTVASLFTGLYPAHHGVISQFRPLPLDLVTLPELLRACGYSTWAGVANVQIDARNVQFEQGFLRFLTTRALGFENPEVQHESSARLLAERFLPWLARHGDEPFFLYLHSVDPHMPYWPEAEADRARFFPEYDGILAETEAIETRSLIQIGAQLGDEDLRFVRSVYDAEVAQQDAHVGWLLDELRSQGQLEQTILVFLSDHGEEFFEHGSFSHIGRLWDVHLRVPLLIWVPPRFREGLRAPGRIDAPVSIAELFATLLDLVGVEDVGPRQAGSFVHLLRAEEADDRESADAAQRSSARSVYARESEVLAALHLAPWKIIRRLHDGQVQHQLFHLTEDPGEQHDLAGERPEELERMRAALEAFERALDQGPHRSRIHDATDIEFSPQERARLEAMGYATSEH